ncbi:MAG: transglycosylase SLT domain-containing protein [Pseudomonadota bacterium]
MKHTLLALCAALGFAACSAAGAAAADDDALAASREIFRKAYPKARAGQRSALDSSRAALKDYPLLPDLHGAWLMSQVGKKNADAAIADYLDRHQDLSPARRLRYSWLRSLHKRKRWSQFLDVYNAHYADGSNTALHCKALTARLRLGQTDGLRDDALALWMVGKSQVDECDPAFSWLAAQGHLSTRLKRQRLELAIDAREFSFARYLARQLGQKEQATVERWRRLYANPARELRKTTGYRDNADDREMLHYAMIKLAGRDPDEAHALWPDVEKRYRFSRDDRHAVERRIAVSSARDHVPGAIDRFVALPTGARNGDTDDWHVRAALREQAWPLALAALDALPPEKIEQEQWRYWRARALEATGRVDEAIALYEALAKNRSYFGFLAADKLGRDYAFTHVPGQPDEAVIAALARVPAFIRARELSLVNLRGQGRSEWDRAVAALDADERAQAAILAHRWQWHSRAIKTGSSNGLMDDLEVRFPLPWWDEFDRHASRLDLSPTWAYGIARSESIFMPDVSSSAGALGLMQLMPSTGRETARQASVRYRGRHSLLDPETNISLGTYYLDSMAERFDDNQVLATAAYNAGPHRVVRWLPAEGSLPPDIWAETIPFRETRRYVRRVLEADAIFHWRVTGGQRRLAAVMLPVDAPEATALAGRVPRSTAATQH